jgi:hypothetical protein
LSYLQRKTKSKKFKSPREGEKWLKNAEHKTVKNDTIAELFMLKATKRGN